jgi:hypothetical protein
LNIGKSLNSGRPTRQWPVFTFDRLGRYPDPVLPTMLPVSTQSPCHRAVCMLLLITTASRGPRAYPHVCGRWRSPPPFQFSYTTLISPLLCSSAAIRFTIAGQHRLLLFSSETCICTTLFASSSSTGFWPEPLANKARKHRSPTTSSYA